MANIRYYLDENVPVAVAAQLARRGIEAVTVRALGLRGDSDMNHLQRATSLGYVFCTHDADFIELAMSGIPHAGIVFGQQHKHGVAVWVSFLELVYEVYSAEEMENRVEYVNS